MNLRMKELHTVQEIIKTLGGRKAVSDLFGVTIRAVAEWRGQGFFPAKIYFRMNSALEPLGCVASRELFTFAPPTNPEAEINRAEAISEVAP